MSPRRSQQEAQRIKRLLADIVQDVFDNDGDVITHEQLAEAHVKRNLSRSADEDVRRYGGVAVALLRRDKNYAIVPITSHIANWTGNPANEEEVAATVAGLGSGGPRVGWYHPSSKDDWLWVFYVGHLSKSGTAAVFHAAKQVDDNPQLISARGRKEIAKRSAEALPVPAGRTERAVLTATVERQ